MSSKWFCDVCGLPDPFGGAGDGIGSCDCSRCECGAALWSSLCSCPPPDEPSFGPDEQAVGAPKGDSKGDS